MNSQLLLEARAIAAALAEQGVASITLTAGGVSQSRLARETDLPSDLVRLAASGGELVGPGVTIRAHEHGFDIVEASADFSESLRQARQTLAVAADRTA